MANEKVYGLYENMEDAASVVHVLVDKGYDPAHLSMIVNNKDGQLDHYTEAVVEEDAVDTEETAGFGAAVGMLTALTTSIIPGVGPVLAAGPFAAALVAGIGAATGAVTGAAVDSVLDLNLDKADAEEYAKVLNEGGAILIAEEYGEWDDDQLEAIFKEYDPERVDDED